MTTILIGMVNGAVVLAATGSAGLGIAAGLTAAVGFALVSAATSPKRS